MSAPETATVAIIILSYLLEALIPLAFWKLRRSLSILTISLVILAGIGTLIYLPAITLLVSVFPFRIFNMFKVIKNRVDPKHLRNDFKRTGFSLAIISACLLLAVLTFDYSRLSFPQLMTGLATAQAVTAFFILSITLKNLLKIRHITTEQHLSDQELPTLTVAIPARNESEYLTGCIESILNSDYPKMEIIVLDDCSHDKTAEIIKSFAHRGVRFIQGEQPSDRWTPKNWAYQQLLNAASGELVLFCGVDIRMDTDAIRKLVNTMQTRAKSMISILPIRTNHSFKDELIQPMRYWWELALPRRLLNRPAALSSCWIINRQSLLDMGGFRSISNSILPESYFARELISFDGYTFARSSREIGVFSFKKLREQRQTALRQKYPQLNKRIENVFLLFLAEFLLFLSPVFLLIYSVAIHNWLLILISALGYLLIVASYALIVRITSLANSFLSVFNYPAVALTELAITLESMIVYEFSEVKWKHRNICIVAMNQGLKAE